MCVRASRSEPFSTARRSQRADELDRLQRDRVVERLVVVARVALDRVREGVHAGRRGDRRRQAEHELGVDQRDVRSDQRRAADVELDLPVVVGDHRPQRHLAARARRRRDCDERRHALAISGRAPALVVEDRAAVLRDDADRLRGVHRRAAAEADEPVAPFGSGTARHRDRRARCRDSGRTSSKTIASSRCSKRPLGESRRDDSRIRDEQRPRDAELAQRLARDERWRSGAVDEPRRHLDRADDLDFDGHPGSSLSRWYGGCEMPLPPVLGVSQIVEREDMEAGDLVLAGRRGSARGRRSTGPG